MKRKQKEDEEINSETLVYVHYFYFCMASRNANNVFLILQYTDIYRCIVYLYKYHIKNIEYYYRFEYVQSHFFLLKKSHSYINRNIRCLVILMNNGNNDGIK